MDSAPQRPEDDIVNEEDEEFLPAPPPQLDSAEIPSAPESTTAHFRRGSMYKDPENLEKARKSAQRSIEIKSKTGLDVDHFCNKSLLSKKLSMRKGAIKRRHASRTSSASFASSRTSSSSNLLGEAGCRNSTGFTKEDWKQFQEKSSRALRTSSDRTASFSGGDLLKESLKKSKKAKSSSNLRPRKVQRANSGEDDCTSSPANARRKPVRIF